MRGPASADFPVHKVKMPHQSANELHRRLTDPDGSRIPGVLRRAINLPRGYRPGQCREPHVWGRSTSFASHPLASIFRRGGSDIFKGQPLTQKFSHVTLADTTVNTSGEVCGLSVCRGVLTLGGPEEH